MEVLRRDDVFAIGPYEICSKERVLHRRGRRVTIAPKAVDLLLVLLANRHRFVSKAELLDRVWPDSDVNESNLTQSVYLLRGLFKKHRDAIAIENVPKRGYRLVERDTSSAIARAAVLAVAATLCFTLMSLPPSHQALSGDAQREYVLARAYQDGATQANLERSARLFERVIHMRPGDAQAYAGLAETDTSLTFYVTGARRRAMLAADAQRLAEYALRLNPQSTQAQAAMGAVDLSIRHDPSNAASHLLRAIELQPAGVDALAWYGSALVSLGRPAQARAVFRRAVTLAPNAPGIVASLAWSEFLSGDYGAAAAFSSRELQRNGGSEIAQVILANAYLRARDFSRAKSVIGLLARHRNAALQAQALLAQLDALSGAKLRALRRLRSLENIADRRRAGSWDAGAIAAAYLAAGDRRHAMIWLSALPSWNRAEVASDPRFASLNTI